MLSDEQAEQIKGQILEQIDRNFPDDKKEIARQQVLAMNNKELEEFLIKNNLIRKEEYSGKEPEHRDGEQKQTQCIFCSIIKGEIPAYKIDENKNSVAVLEINPISKGHSLIIPKEHINSAEKIPKNAFSLAKKLAKKIKSKLKPKEISIYSSSMFEHSIINILPVYSSENSASKRNLAKQEELQKLQILLEVKKKIKTGRAKPKARILKEGIRIPRRIP